MYLKFKIIFLLPEKAIYIFHISLSIIYRQKKNILFPFLEIFTLFYKMKENTSKTYPK